MSKIVPSGGIRGVPKEEAASRTLSVGMTYLRPLTCLACRYGILPGHLHEPRPEGPRFLDIACDEKGRPVLG